jgi:lipid A export ATP-binding/permease protein msbA
MKVIESENYNSIKKLRKYMKRYSIPIFLNILLAMISSAVSSAPLALIKRLFDKGIIESNEKDILYAAGSMILLAVVGAVLVYWNTVFSALISASIYKNIVDDIYIKIQTLDMEYFSSAKIGELMTKVITDPNNINSVIKETFNMIPEVFKVVICLGIALSIDWKLTLGILIVAPVLITIVKKYSKKLKRSGKKRQEAMGLINSKLQESLSGIRVIKAFAMEKEEIRDFRIKNTKLKRIAIQTAKYNARSSAVSEALNYIMIAGLLLAGGYRVLRGHDFTPGDFVTIMGAISSMYTPIRRAITRFNEISVDIPSVGRVFEILEEEPKIIDNENKILFQYFSDNITFENVDFKYKDSDEKILKNINFTVKKGETMAFVGNSGGGKSTLVNLIPRFFDVSNGAIKIDGVNIKDYDVKSLRKNIGIVPQETFLFSGTILQNIKYGKRDATFEEIKEAAKKANAHEFIKKLEDGYNTEIGERGVKLSGGQKQRIAIARAILENPQILILDEATSALDNESEKLVQDALEKLMENKTTFVIAHRLTTIENSDKIVVLQQGEIKETGTHAELLEKNGLYKSLYNKNFDFSRKK